MKKINLPKLIDILKISRKKNKDNLLSINTTYSPNVSIGYPSGSLHSTLNNIYSNSAYTHTSTSSTSSTISVEYFNQERRKYLKKELENDPELLNEILTDLRKEKIEKIKSKGGF